MIKNLLSQANIKSTTCWPIHKLLCVLLFLAAINNATFAQVAGYNLTSSVYTGAPVGPVPSAFTFLTAGKTNLAATAGNIDSFVGTVALPFPFNFNGIIYNNVNISLNGFVTFGGVLPGLQEITPISSTSNYDAVIAPYAWDLDLVSASGALNVSTETVNSGPNRIFKIEWVVKRSDNAGTAATTDSPNLSFQLWLYETTNVVQFQYGTFVPFTNAQSVSYGQVGLRGQTNTDFKNFTLSAGNNFPTSTLPFGTLNTATVYLSPNNVGGPAFRSSIPGSAHRIYTWTPPTCFAPTNLQVSNVLINSATVSFLAPTPAAASYAYEVRTSGAGGSGATGLVSSGTSTGTTNLTALLSNTNYFVYFQSNCPPLGSWSRPLAFTTLCDSQVVPYYQFFDDDAGPNPDAALPPITPILAACNKTQNLGTGANWGAGDANGPPADASSMSNMVLMYDGQNIPGNTNAANSWFYLRGVFLDASKSYYVNYTYACSPTLLNSMKVAFGTQPDAAFMTTILDDHPSFRGGIFSNKVIFSPPTTGVYYIGFNAYSAMNRGYLWVDEIEVNESFCRKPTSLAVGTINRTNANFSFTAPTPQPTGGYVYYVATTPFTPPLASNTLGSGTIPVGASTFTIPGLSPGTNYCVFVRSACGGGEFGQWTSSVCFTTLPPLPAAPCTPNPSSVDDVGITNVTFSTVNNTTGAEIGNYGNYTNLIGNVAQGSTVNVDITFNTSVFDYNTKIWVNWDNDGFFTVAENVVSGLSSTTSPNTLSLLFVVPIGQPLGNYTMRIGGTDFAPGINGVGPGLGSCYTGSYGTFEDYTLNVVVAPPALTINSSSSTQCAASNSPLITITSTVSDFNSYSWSPGGVTGTPATGYTINNPTSQVYILTGTQTVAPFSTNSVKYNYIANAKPSTIAITPASASSCQTDTTPVMLTASGGIISGINVLTEDFNGAATGWVATTNPAHTGGTPANGFWLTKPSPYVYGGTFGTTFISNDSSQFYLSNSDSQGFTSTTSTVLTSPLFSLVGYTAATLKFYQYYRGYGNGSAVVQISSGGPWQTLQTATTLSIGTATNFAETTLTIPASFAGLANLQIRFVYQTNWGWYWGIDNVSVIGSAPGKITWSPITGLFEDSLGAVPYTGDFRSIIYAKPAATQVYTSTSSTEAPAPICPESKTVTVTVQPISKGIAPANQSLCFGLPNPLTITGIVGTPIQWQWSNDAAFTVPNNISFSASATLSGVKMNTPIIVADRYYRLIIKNGACTTYSDIIKVTYDAVIWSAGAWSNGTGPTISQAAIFDSAYSSVGNLSACSIILRSGAAVVINAGNTLTVANTITTGTGGGTLEFKNTANLIQNTTVANTVPIKYNRTSNLMRVYDFTYWSSPVIGQTLFNLSPLTLSDKYYSWQNTYLPFSYYDWLISVNGALTMAPGKGYAIRSPLVFGSAPAVFNGVFNGIPNNGNVTSSIIVSGAVGPSPIGNRLNLLGNPYPSGLSANLFLDANKTIIDGTIYFWTHNTGVSAAQLTYNNNDYASYNFTGGTTTTAASTQPVTGGVGSSTVPDGFIAAGQAFFANGILNSNSTSTVTFTNAMRITNNATFYRSSNDGTIGTVSPNSTSPLLNYEKNRIWLDLYNTQGAFSQMLYGNIEGATNAKDSLYDGLLFDDTAGISLYSLLGNERLTIKGNGLPFNQTDTNDIGYIAKQAGNYTIALSNFDGLFNNENIYLEDKLLHVIHDLKLSNYNFSTAVGTFNDRFMLRFTNATLANDKFETDNRNIYVYKNSNGINVKSFNGMLDEVIIFDLGGRKIYSKDKINSNEFLIKDLNFANQVLLVKARNTEGKVFTQKIVF